MLKNDYKLAFFHILLPYTINYYEKGLIIPDILISSFKELNDDNDKMKSFINTFYVKTDNDSDRISKNDFLSNYESHYKLKNISWFNLLNDIKRLGLNYDRQKRVNGVQGCITKLKLDNISVVDNIKDILEVDKVEHNSKTKILKQKINVEKTIRNIISKYIFTDFEKITLLNIETKNKSITIHDGLCLLREIEQNKKKSIHNLRMS